jgi:hypothetical protein
MTKLIHPNSSWGTQETPYTLKSSLNFNFLLLLLLFPSSTSKLMQVNNGVTLQKSEDSPSFPS